MAQKIDSNVTGLRFAEEQSLRTLPGAPIWFPLEPNSYKDFGGQLSTIARNPINPSRQRKKGTVTDLDASGGFNQDVTQTNTTRLLQGVLFAAAREKKTTQPLNAAAVVMTGVTGAAETYSAAAGLDTFLVNHLVLASGFGVATNNGLKKVTAVAAGLLTAEGLDDEAAPPASAKIETVGYEFAAGTLDVEMVGGLPRLKRASGAVDFTTLGLIPGEWVFVGGDAAAAQFENNVGFARVNAIGQDYIELDKTDWTPQAEVGAAKTIRVYFGTVIKNEAAAELIKRYTYQLERTLGQDANGTMAEYLVGAVPNEFTLDVKQADKVTSDFGFIAVDNEQRTGLEGVKGGARPNLVNADAFNTSSDFSRIKLARVTPGDAAPVPLFAFATELSLSLKNNVSPNKAIGILGAFDTSAGTFEVGGKITAYFASIEAVQAVRENADVTIDIAMVKNNAGFVFDVPLLSLGDGRLNVEQDKAIQLPLEMNAAESKFNHTFLVNVFSYLPSIAG